MGVYRQHGPPTTIKNAYDSEQIGNLTVTPTSPIGYLLYTSRV